MFKQAFGSSKSQEYVRPLVVCGPSGGGKSTILNKLFEKYPNSFAFSVSHTTRKPRPGELDGKDYHYIEREKMERMIQEQAFLEHAEFSGNLYGTSQEAVAAVQKSGRICVLDIELQLQGVRNVRASPLHSNEDQRPRYIFVQPPSFDVLEQRLRSRQTEDESSLAKRLERARVDMEQVGAEPELFDHIIINDDLQVAYEEMEQILELDLNRLSSNE